MRASSSADAMPLAACGVTAILAAVFWLPFGAERQLAITAASLAGRTLRVAASAPTAPPSSVLTPAAPSAPMPKPSRTIKQASGAQPAKKAGASQPAAPAPTASAPAVGATGGARAMPQVASIQDIQERYEAEPSKYPLDKRAAKDGVTMTLDGIARLDRWFVVKVTLANETKTDFFVNDVAAHAGSVPLAGRAAFRILVEPQRERCGYLLFEKPLAGAAVHVALKEDGGRNRTLEIPVPYPF